MKNPCFRMGTNLENHARTGSNNHDYAFWTQPAMTHTSRGRAFENHRNRVRAKMDQAAEHRQEAAALESRAQSLRQTPRVKGDAEREYQALRIERDNTISVGSPVLRHGWAVGKGYVVKVNKKSYTTEWEDGSTHAVDKIYVQYDPSRQPREASKPYPFKKVMWWPLFHLAITAPSATFCASIETASATAIGANTRMTGTLTRPHATLLTLS
ncbi:hypothetical protein SCOR_27465 [Sulfidibacter corallicola]|uniref:Uncharacterized protein n=1 Tax=Sulfidibacter corallicola TaxID=2818388 RepID=A0A8A4TNC3_SULCO|nr:hypothetical protein [Sulfidibacter corallicola]QTD50704.1 hypothetical protein J3U87_34390 [Sulfidibacter corallicola]